MLGTFDMATNPKYNNSLWCDRATAHTSLFSGMIVFPLESNYFQTWGYSTSLFGAEGAHLPRYILPPGPSTGTRGQHNQKPNWQPVVQESRSIVFVGCLRVVVWDRGWAQGDLNQHRPAQNSGI